MIHHKSKVGTHKPTQAELTGFPAQQKVSDPEEAFNNFFLPQ